jgi:hypothetical protein
MPQLIIQLLPAFFRTFIALHIIRIEPGHEGSKSIGNTITTHCKQGTTKPGAGDTLKIG